MTPSSQHALDANLENRPVLKAQLQSCGVRINPVASHRDGGAGPAEGITLMMDGRSLTVPTGCDFVSESPYTIQSRNGSHLLFKDASLLRAVTIPHPPKFYHLTTREGIPYHKIALLHGTNCLASTVIQHCVFWNSDRRCQFCGIELSLNAKATIPKKSPHQLLEVTRAACELDSIQHITLTTGAQARSSDEVDHLASCCSSIKSETAIPIHVQLMPPDDLKLLEQLKKSGADTVGIHIESFDFEVLERVAPNKAGKDLMHYMNVWKESVNIFGVNQVSSFIIVGLGESRESVLEGTALLCELGVYPYIVPLRPIPKTPFASHKPPHPDEMISIYQQAATLLDSHGLSWRNSKAGCVRCGACSALPDFEHQ